MGLRVQGFRVQGIGFRVLKFQVSCIRIHTDPLLRRPGGAKRQVAPTVLLEEGLGFRVWGLGFGVWGLGRCLYLIFGRWLLIGFNVAL